MLWSFWGVTFLTMFSLLKFSCISNKETPASFACKHRIDLRPRSTIFMGKIRVKKPFGYVIHFLLNSVTCQPRLSLQPSYPSYPGSWSIYLPIYQEISDQDCFRRIVQGCTLVVGPHAHRSVSCSPHHKYLQNLLMFW